MHQIFFEAFSLSCLKKVSFLGTGCSSNSPERLATYISYLRTNFSAIHTLDTDEGTIDHLVEAQNDFPELIMPELQAIMISSNWASFNSSSSIFELLDSRRKLGKPIQVLDLTQCNSDFGELMPFLEDFDGFKVVWTTWNDDGVLEYVCGSGHPERLPYHRANAVWYVFIGGLGCRLIVTN